MYRFRACTSLYIVFKRTSQFSIIELDRCASIPTTRSRSSHDQVRKLSKFKSNMPKTKVDKSKPSQVVKQEKQKTTNAVNQPIFLNADNSILIRILAKPGAKQNCITGITDDCIGVQISAPPVDGEANAELLKFVASILGIKKSAISLDKGSRSRTKVLILEPSVGLNVEEVEQKISSQFS